MSSETLITEAVKPATGVPDGQAPQPVRSGENENLDWDAWIETSPARAKGTIQVQVVFVGRSRPIPVADPSAE